MQYLQQPSSKHFIFDLSGPTPAAARPKGAVRRVSSTGSIDRPATACDSGSIRRSHELEHLHHLEDILRRSSQRTVERDFAASADSAGLPPELGSSFTPESIQPLV